MPQSAIRRRNYMGSWSDCRMRIVAVVGEGVEWLGWWASDIARLTWADSTRIGATFHAKGRDIPRCC